MEREEVLKGKIGLRLVIAAKLTRTYAIQKFYAEKYEITPEQFTILATLIEHDGLYQRQIGAITLKDRPNITRLTRILEGSQNNKTLTREKFIKFSLLKKVVKCMKKFYLQ